MRPGITLQIEAGREPAVRKHVICVTTHSAFAAGHENIVLVQHDALGMVGCGAAVCGRLTVTFLSQLQSRQLEQPTGCRKKPDFTNLFTQHRIFDAHRPVRHEPRIIETRAPGQREKIIPVKGAGQTLPVQHRVVFQIIRNAAIGIDVGKINLAAGLQKSPGLFEHGLLVRRQIDNAVRDDDVESTGFESSLLQDLDIAVDEFDV
jgi:hypothetical protein